MEWHHGKIRGMKLNVQDLVWSPAAHIANQIGVRRGSTRFPSLIRLASCTTEEDRQADLCSRKEGERKTPTAMLIIPDEKVAVIISLSQQMLESPNHIMHENLLSSRSNRRGVAIKSVRPKRLIPWKIVTVLPSIQGNLLSRETTNSRVKLLRCHAIRPEGGHAHHGDVVSKVVVVHWLKACIAVSHEVPNLIGRDAMVAKHDAFLHDKVLWKVRALRHKPWVRLL